MRRMRDGRQQPWLRCNCWYGPDQMVGDYHYRMARTEARMLYVPPVLPTEGYPARCPGRLAFFNGSIYYGMGNRCDYPCTPAVAPFQQHSLHEE